MISIKKFVFNSFQANTYLISDAIGNCLVVDPGCQTPAEQEVLSQYILKEKLNLKGIINTHCHVDHILGNKYLKKHFDVPFMIHQEDLLLLISSVEQGIIFGIDVDPSPKPDQFLNDGDIVPLGDSEFRVIHVPGHSPGGIVLYNSLEKVIFTGDTLFQGSIGRADLPGGNYNSLISGIKNKLLVLEPETTVYPGHGEPTTIGAELESNPYLS